MSFSVYDASILPEHFKYPSSYLAVSEGEGKTVDLGAWWFIDANSSFGTLSFDLREIDELNLIPFARHFDWEASFDGDDTTGDPEIYMFDLGNMSNRFKMKNFDEWFNSLDDLYL